MKTRAEAYLDWLTELFGEEDAIRRVEAADGGPAISVFFYHDLPEEGMTTAITFGLSEGPTPVELMVTLNTHDESWGLAAAYFAAQFRGVKEFRYQSLFTLDEPISQESEMAGFFVLAPAILDRADSVVELPGRTIHLRGMYPIYREEVRLLESIGLERFWKHPDFDMYEVRRPNLGR